MGDEVKGLPQPPDRRPLFNPKKRGFFGKIGKIKRPKKARQYGPKLRYRKDIDGPKLGPRRRKKLVGVSGAGRRYGPKFLKSKAGKGQKLKRNGGGKRRTGRGGARRSGNSWLLKLAQRAVARHLQKALRPRKTPKDYRHHGAKGVRKSGRTGLGGR